jgi:hypothetical protein
MAWVSAGPCMRLVAFATRRHPPAAAILADPSFDPLSTTITSSDSHSRIRRSDHNKSAVSSRVLNETVMTATRPGITRRSGQRTMSVSITKLGSDPNFQTVLTPTTVGPWPAHRDCPSANSAVSTKGVMYVSCDSDLGHKCMHLTYGYLFAGIGQVSNAAGRSHRGSSPSRTRAYVHAGSPGT